MLASLSKISVEPKWLYGDFLIGRTPAEIATVWGISEDDVKAALDAEGARRGVKVDYQPKPAQKMQPKPIKRTKPTTTAGMYRLPDVMEMVGLKHAGMQKIRNLIDDVEVLVSIEARGRNLRCRMTYVTLDGLKQWRDRAVLRTDKIKRLEKFIQMEQVDVKVVDGMYRLRDVMQRVGISADSTSDLRKRRIDAGETVKLLEQCGHHPRCPVMYVTLAGLKQWRDSAQVRRDSVKRLSAFILDQERRLAAHVEG